MATYSNPHWLLCHIRNSFISTDDTGMCETVMVSDDLPKHYLRKYQGNSMSRNMQKQQQRRSLASGTQQPQQPAAHTTQRNYDPPLQEVDFICYPNLDQSDDEDVDLTAQSFDIQMYPEVGAHRFRSNTAQKLEKMDIARRKAAKTKCVNYDDEIIQPERSDFFVRKSVKGQEILTQQQCDNFKSKLTLQLANSPKQVQNKFQEYAKYDGTSQSGIQTKRINVFLSMLPEKQRNYPIKICVLSHAKIADQPQQPAAHTTQRNYDPPLQEVDFICYPNLDQSDDEDVDLTAQSFDIQMYPEVGAHRFRSNTAQKLEKMDIARRKAAKTKCVNYDDEIIQPERSDFFVRKSVKGQEILTQQQCDNFKSKLTLQLANSPKQVQNKFQEYAKYDGTSQSGIQTKRINVFLSMLPEKQRNYPIKICVLSHAKIADVIGLVCYKATLEFPDLPLKSIRHYGLYMTEDNDDLEDFPPLDHREPCSKFGFSHLTLAERRPLAAVTRIDYGHGIAPTKSMTSEEEKARLAALAIHSLNCSGVGEDGFKNPDDRDDIDGSSRLDDLGRVDDLEERILIQDNMLEAPVYRSYNLNIIDKKFFKTEVSLGISGERIEIDQHKNAKFWTKQRAITYPIDAVAHCEIVEKRTMKAVLRIWLKTASAIHPSAFNDNNKNSLSLPAHSPTSPGHYPHFSSPFSFLSSSSVSASSSSQQPIRFKHYDFETTIPTAEQINKKLNCILEMCSSDVRREFLQVRQRKLEKSQAKKHLKL